MPRLNSLGDWCAGIGGGRVSAKGAYVLPYQSGGANWVDDDHVIGQVCGTPCETWTWNRLTGAIVRVSTRGTQTTFANGGVWAIWGAGHGVSTSTGLDYPLSFHGGVGPDGAIAIKTLYQSYGPWDVIEVGATGNDAADFASGKRWQLTAGDASSICLLGGGKAIWKENGVARAVGVSVPLILSTPFSWLDAIQIAGVWWVLYQGGNGRLVFHPFTSTVGYVVASGNTFRPDVVLLPTGKVRVVWAVTEGEPPTDVRSLDIDLTSPRSVLALGGASVRSLWCGWFTFGPVSGFPGNCYAQVGPVGAQLPETLVYTTGGQLLAQYVAAEGLGMNIETEIAAARARHPTLPVIAYVTRAKFGGAISSADWQGIEAYRGAAESVAAFDAAVRAEVARVPLAMLIPQVYTSNTNNTTDLASIVPIVMGIANALANVVGLLNFSGAGRATGYQDHPEVWPLWSAAFAGTLVPGTGGTPPVPVPGGPGGLPPRPFLHRRPSRPRLYRQDRRSPNRWR